MLTHSASLMRLEAKSLELSLERQAQFREQETLRSREQQSILFQYFEDQLKRSREQQDPLFKHFRERRSNRTKRGLNKKLSKIASSL